VTSAELLAVWEPTPTIATITVGSLALYAAFVRGRFDRRTPWFAAGVAVFFVALASPLGVLANGYLFSAHMLQHLLLVLVVPPLLLLGLPRGPEVAATPSRLHPAYHYGSPWLAGVGAMWIWHARALCDAAATSPGVRWFQTVSLITLGLAYWRPVFSPRSQDCYPPFAAVLYLFSACVACTILGILLTFSPLTVCSVYAHPVDRLGVLPLLRDDWGLTPAADQQLGGLMMWVPACFVYAAAILTMLARYYRDEQVPPLAIGTAPPAAEVK
jgi:putative membrane protein